MTRLKKIVASITALTEEGHRPCLDCVYKHLCQAMIVHEEEVFMGYPQHIRRVIGHLSEASRESMPHYSDLANVLREHRLRVRETPEYYPPYMALMDYVEAIIAAEDQKLPIPEVPDYLRPANPTAK
jgi:hypothetical protein